MVKRYRKLATYTLPEEMVLKLKKLHKKTGVPVSRIVERSIREFKLVGGRWS